MEQNTENKAEVILAPEQNKDVKVEQGKPSLILLEILVHGVSKDKKNIKKLLDNLQEQLTERRARHRARVLWYVDEGEKSTEEKKQWFKENMNCKYFVYGHEEGKYYAPKDFVKETLLKIKKFEDSYIKMKSAGIGVNKLKKENEDTEPKEENENTR